MHLGISDYNIEEGLSPKLLRVFLNSVLCWHADLNLYLAILEMYLPYLLPQMHLDSFERMSSDTVI